ncbi:hypothetical protein F5Y17DRAFT_441122 [Xylariaceae sp. FL0594]|nr:hypothetical protein F5Y17DRAFT_441122 [Xylariaceae sp. FL0594]
MLHFVAVLCAIPTLPKHDMEASATNEDDEQRILAEICGAVAVSGQCYPNLPLETPVCQDTSSTYGHVINISKQPHLFTLI